MNSGPEDGLELQPERLGGREGTSWVMRSPRQRKERGKKRVQTPSRLWPKPSHRVPRVGEPSEGKGPSRFTGRDTEARAMRQAGAEGLPCARCDRQVPRASRVPGLFRALGVQQ